MARSQIARDLLRGSWLASCRQEQPSSQRAKPKVSLGSVQKRPPSAISKLHEIEFDHPSCASTIAAALDRGDVQSQV
jgi:hypothetical protein